MQEIEFKVETEELGAGIRNVVTILIDDARLQEIIPAAEMPYARAEGPPDLPETMPGC